MAKEFTTSELAELLGCSRDTIERKAKKECWQGIKRSRREGGTLWQLKSMPKTTQEAIQLKLMPAVKNDTKMSAKDIVAVNNDSNLSTLKEITKVATTERQKCVRDARVSIINTVERYKNEFGARKAEEIVANAIKEGSDITLTTLAQQALCRGGKIEPRTLREWKTLYAKYGTDALLPKQKNRLSSIFPAWMPKMLELYRRPSKPSVAQCYEALQKQGVELPTLRTVQRTLKKLGTPELQKGRMLPREYKKLLPFVRRKFDTLLPLDVFTADGHTLDALVRHPIHGKPFRPEVTSILDIATRMCVGWSVSLNENSFGVADALRLAVTKYGIPAIFYTDNGAGFKNDMLENPKTGMLTRLGITPQHSLPYASQARGVIERFQQTLIRAARELPSYCGLDMDSEAFKLVQKRVKKDIDTKGKSDLMMEWDTFMRFLALKMDEYNTRLHSTLKESPWDRWNKLIEQVDVIKPTGAELEDLFRPYVERTVSRCEIRLFSGIYYSEALWDLHKQTVRVGYDIHDPSKVWVQDNKGRFITIAELGGNSQDYVPKSVIERANDKRYESKIERIDNKKALAQLEHNGGKKVIEAQPLTEEQKQREQALAKQLENIEKKEVSNEFTAKEERFKRFLEIEELLQNGASIKFEELEWYKRYKNTPECTARIKLHNALA